MKTINVNTHEIELARKNGTQERFKSRLVEELISQRYTLGQQIALLRQQGEKPVEYAAFCAYAEECKARVRAFLDDPTRKTL